MMQGRLWTDQRLRTLMVKSLDNAKRGDPNDKVLDEAKAHGYTMDDILEVAGEYVNLLAKA